MPILFALCPVLAVVAGLATGPAPLSPFDSDGPEPRPAPMVGDPAARVSVAFGSEAADAARRPAPTVRSTAPTQDDGAQDDGAPDDVAPAADNPAVALLEELEISARDLEAFTATVHYQTLDALLGEKTIHKGSLIYRVDPVTRAKSFAILFDKLIEVADQGNRLNEEDKHYVFADGWLAEIDHQNRQFVKRQIAAPGEDFDPLKLGEGPIPLPIDQPTDEVLRRFDVTAAELPEEGPLAKLRGTIEVDGIRLVPRPGRPEEKDFAEVTIFYDRLTRLPAGIDVVEPNKNRKTVRLGNLRRNPPLDAELLSKLSIETPDGDWRVDIRPMSR